RSEVGQGVGLAVDALEREGGRGFAHRAGGVGGQAGESQAGEEQQGRGGRVESGHERSSGRLWFQVSRFRWASQGAAAAQAASPRASRKLKAGRRAAWSRATRRRSQAHRAMASRSSSIQAMPTKLTWRDSPQRVTNSAAAAAKPSASRPVPEAGAPRRPQSQSAARVAATARSVPGTGRTSTAKPAAGVPTGPGAAGAVPKGTVRFASRGGVRPPSPVTVQAKTVSLG